MKAISRYLFLLLFVCGTALALKTTDRRAHHFSAADEGARQKEENEFLQSVLQQLQPSRFHGRVEQAWSKADFQAQLEEAFQKNDPCAVLELIHSTKDASPREFWAAGMGVLLAHAGDRSPVLEELLANEDSPLYGVVKEGAKTIETRFLNALLDSGQLKTVDEADEQSHSRRSRMNLERSIATFHELTKEDPENGAHFYFLATALRENGATKEEVRGAMAQASRLARFESFYQSIFDQLQRVAYTNVAAFVWVHFFLEAMPVPDFELGVRYLKYWAHTEEPGKWAAHRLAKHLIELGTKIKAQSPGYQFSRAEYLLGQNLRLSVEGNAAVNWEEYGKRMREAQSFISETPRPVVDAEVSLYRDRIESKRSCGPEAWKSLFAAYKAKPAGG